MILSSLKLENFRNYKNFEIDLDKVTVFIGQNGIGKTNLIEAIYLLSIGKSYRTREDSDMILWKENFCRIIGKTDSAKLETFVSRFPSKVKNIKINDVKKKITELFGKLKIVIFSPESIDIVTGSPKERRKFLDIILCQTDKNYLNNLFMLQKVLKNRNRLLFEIKLGRSKAEELSFWNKKLIELSNPIFKKRKNLINYINTKIEDIYKKIGEKNESLKIKYTPVINDLDKYEEMITKNLDREIGEGATIFGPHRDNFDFILENKNVNSFASRGEIRSVIFALKMAELQFIKEQENRPLFLLDDIFSELDKTRCKKLSEIILEQPTIITTTDINFLSQNLQNRAKIVELKEKI